MTWIVAIVVVLAGLFVWGVARIRRGHAQSSAALLALTQADMPALIDECISGFERLGESLDLDDPERATALLDRYLQGHGLVRLKLAFARPGFDWRFVLPIGAALGDLLRRHASGRWQPADGGGLCIVLPAGDGTATAHPFDKAMLLGAAGEDGAVTAYVAAARAMATGQLTLASVD